MERSKKYSEWDPLLLYARSIKEEGGFLFVDRPTPMPRVVREKLGILLANEGVAACGQTVIPLIHLLLPMYLRILAWILLQFPLRKILQLYCKLENARIRR